MCWASEATREAELSVEIVVLALESSTLSCLLDRVRKACLTLTRLWLTSPSGSLRAESCSAGHHLEISVKVLEPLSRKVFGVAGGHGSSFLWYIILADATTVRVIGDPSNPFHLLSAHRDSFLEMAGLLGLTTLHFLKRHWLDLLRAGPCTHHGHRTASDTCSCCGPAPTTNLTNVSFLSHYMHWQWHHRACTKSHLAKFWC